MRNKSLNNQTVCDFSPEGAFVICWTPGLVVLLLDGLHCKSCKVVKLKRWLLLLAVLNSVMNPCIYSYKDEEMWQTFKNLLRCIGNGTRRQRSTKANARPLSSAQDTGNSQLPSEETKKDDQAILKTWNLLPALLFSSDWMCLMKIQLTRKRRYTIISSWFQRVVKLKVLYWRDTTGQLLH